MNRAHLIELDPTERQKEFLGKACGVARYTWNWALAECEKTYSETGKSANISDLKKRWNQVKPAWVYESPKDANQQPFAFLKKCYAGFFKKTNKRPRFKKKGKSKDSFYVSNDKFSVSDRHVKLPLIGKLRLKELPRFSGKILSATVSRRADRWFISISYELPDIKPVAPNRVVGVDLGIKDLAVTSDGMRFANPKHLKKAKKRLRLAQRKVSRRVKGSKNRRKAITKLSRIHYKVGNQRKDTLHKITTIIAKSAKVVVIEDLNVSGMVKNHNLAAAISDCGFFEFRRQLDYKAKRVIVADRFFPSSKLCHCCGYKNKQLKLSDRFWSCECGVTHDRDLNAALNLKSLGEAIPESTPVEIGVPKKVYLLRSRSKKQEPSSEHLCSRVG
jgi:putative transposase